MRLNIDAKKKAFALQRVQKKREREREREREGGERIVQIENYRILAIIERKS